jgi:diguanylate cyclase
MEILRDLIKDNQAFLVKRILHYAKLHDYVKYTSTLEEAWIASISGLSEALINGILTDKQIPEIEVDHDFTNNPISSFGVIEARIHRHRGVSLEMFLGLMKYYRQSYIDLVKEKVVDQEQQNLYLLWINRFFDHNEIAFCSEWTAQSRELMLSELQDTNRRLTNEKNKYLTIFESIPTPAILLDAENRCINMNYSAQLLFQENIRSSGHIYYSNSSEQPTLSDALPWIINEFMDFYQGDEMEATVEKDFESSSQGNRNLIIKFHRMLDVSNKFEGTVILFTDMTERKIIEEQLRHISFHDILTGLYNRAYMEQEIIRISTGRFNPVGFISLDIDGLKLINDNLGHNAGDTLLRTVSQIIKSCFRDSDIVARCGGDEFAVLMPASDALTVQNACQRISDKILEHNKLFLNMPVSVSMGWAVRSLAINEKFSNVIREADRLMYEDKQENHLKYANLFKQRFKEYGDKLFR